MGPIYNPHNFEGLIVNKDGDVKEILFLEKKTIIKNIYKGI